MSFFEELLNTDSETATARLQERVEKLQKNRGFVKDERYWSPEVGKDGTGFAIIRFLPGTDKETGPFVQLFSHSFKGPTGLFYIKNSPETIGKPCPASEFYWQQWKLDKEAARSFSRRVNYISNILVINHPLRPDDNGRVFLYKYGTKIYDKVKLCNNPQEPGLMSFSPFHPLYGANFRLRVKTKAKQFPNYDDSVFDTPGPLSTDPASIRKVFDAQYDLAAEVAPDKFESYDALKKRLHEVLDLDDHTEVAVANDVEPWAVSPSTQVSEEPAEAKPETEDLAFFQKLASGN